MYVFPSEIYVKILSYLSYDDLLVVRNVNEYFRKLVNYVVGTKTVWIKSCDDRAPVHKMFSTNEYVYVDKCFLGRSLIGFQRRTELQSEIKQLILPSPNLLSDLVSFNNLIHLELISNSKRNLNKNFVLRGNDLEVICIQLNGRSVGIKEIAEISGSPEFRFLIDCPKLKSFKTDVDLNYFNFLFPESIIHLHCPKNTKPINDLTNLRRLVCTEFDYKNNIFADLEYLEYLSFYYTNYQNEETIELFDTLHNETLTIFYRDVNVNAGSLDDESTLNIMFDLPDRPYFVSNFARVYTSFLDFIDPVRFPSMMNYELNISSLNDLPSELIQKMANVRVLFVNDSIEMEKWIEILKVTNLEAIFIKSSIAQNFYDLLPTYCPNLMEFEIKNFDNLNFVLKLKYLHKLKCAKFFHFNLFVLMLRQLHHLVEIKLRTGYEIVLNERIECYLNDHIVSNETRETFDTTSLHLGSWSELFRNLGN